MLRRSLFRFAGGDKTSFADKRRVIHPLVPSPTATASLIKLGFTTDAMKTSVKNSFASSGAVEKEMLGIPDRLEGERSRAALEKVADPDFESLVDFIKGVHFDQVVTGRRFQKLYEKLSENDDILIWLCFASMSVLNPGDMSSRLIYRHLEALVLAVANQEMPQRTAFRFFESAVRSPAYREIAARQLQSGQTTRLAGLCAAADTMTKLGICRRPMTAYFELYQRICERSEALSPWGIPPLYQFESTMQLEDRLKLFSRNAKDEAPEAKRHQRALRARWNRGTIFWVPPNWLQQKKFAGTTFLQHPMLIPD